MKRQHTEGEPAYMALLRKHGLINPRQMDAFHLWMRLCEDPVVRERGKKKAAAKRPAHMASFASGYSYADFVLKQMTPKELAALKQRLGIRPEKEFAVVR